MKYTKEEARKRRKMRIRKKISGTSERPRLVIFRSNTNIYGQIIDDITGRTLVSLSSLTLSKKESSKLKMNKETATKVGQEIAKMAKVQNIESVVFDRNGYIYHGCIKAFADGARDAGLKF